MKEKLINNLGLKLLSIFLAFFVWLVVVNVANPKVRRSEDVTLEIENAQVLEAAQRTYEITGKSTVAVYYDVWTRDEYKISSSDFRAYVDLAELYDVTGSVQVKIEVLNNKDLISNPEARPGVVHVETEELQKKSFELKIDAAGEPEDGYDVTGISLSPSYVLVEGPVSKVGLISYAGVEISLDGLTGNDQGVAAPVFYDANGNKLTISDRIEVNTPEIQYQVTVNKVKNLPLDFEVSGVAAAGYQYTGVESAVKNVSVTGLTSNLASINRITIPATELSVSGATSDRVVTVDLNKYLPAGVELAESQDPQVEIRLRVERLVNRTITLTEGEITKENASEELRYRLTPNRIEVTVQGLKDELDSLNGAALGAAVNVSGLLEGSHTGTLKFAGGDVFRVVNYTDFKIDVTPGSSITEGSTAEGSTSTAAEQDSTGAETSEGSAEETAKPETAVTTEAS